MKLSKDEIVSFKQDSLKWAQRFKVCMLLDNNFSVNACGYKNVEFIIAAGVKRELRCDIGNAFDQLRSFIDSSPDSYIFGGFSYDLKNELEKLTSSNFSGIHFPDLYFFEPEYFLMIDQDGNVHGNENLTNIIKGDQHHVSHHTASHVQVKPRVSEKEYIRNVNAIRDQIAEGNVYELNYCVEFFNEKVLIDPADIYEKLKNKSPTPFGAFFKCYDQYLMCASPERFIKKERSTLISQPIKGTIRRGMNTEEDESFKQQLLNSEKERAENLMIVDLVRNDLARSSKTGTVNVNELFGIYTFRHVHQMISTVSSIIRNDTHPVIAIRNAFPMGSMTGAPKIKAMELIEHFEQTRRGWYSGAVGYFTPAGDFDFNVVIRSIQYNALTGFLSYEVGSAITFDSDPQSEYEECVLKAKAIMEALNGED